MGPGSGACLTHAASCCPAARPPRARHTAASPRRSARAARGRARPPPRPQLPPSAARADRPPTAAAAPSANGMRSHIAGGIVRSIAHRAPRAAHSPSTCRRRPSGRPTSWRRRLRSVSRTDARSRCCSPLHSVRCCGRNPRRRSPAHTGMCHPGRGRGRSSPSGSCATRNEPRRTPAHTHIAARPHNAPAPSTSPTRSAPPRGSCCLCGMDWRHSRQRRSCCCPPGARRGGWPHTRSRRARRTSSCTLGQRSRLRSGTRPGGSGPARAARCSRLGTPGRSTTARASLDRTRNRCACTRRARSTRPGTLADRRARPASQRRSGTRRPCRTAPAAPRTLHRTDSRMRRPSIRAGTHTCSRGTTSSSRHQSSCRGTHAHGSPARARARRERTHTRTHTHMTRGQEASTGCASAASRFGEGAGERTMPV